RGLDAALSAALGVDASGFSVAWQGHWRERLDRAEAELDALRDRVWARWEALDLLPEQEQRPLTRRCQTLMEEVSAHRERLALQRRNNRRLRKLLGNLDKAMEQSKPLADKSLRALVAEAEGLMQAQGADLQLGDALARARDRLEERLRKQKHSAEQRVAQLEEKLQELAGAIEPKSRGHHRACGGKRSAAEGLRRGGGAAEQACAACAGPPEMAQVGRGSAPHRSV
ncbi:MAG: hypothetical protein P8Y25_08895, partial [Chromatiaceae bacterium]